jgi:putative transposase
MSTTATPPTWTKERSATLAQARAKNPERFATTNDPKILALPRPAWINQPQEITEQLAA